MARAPGRRPAARLLAPLAALLGLVLHDPASAAARVDLYSGDLAGDGWQAEGVSLWLELGTEGVLTAGLEVARLTLPAGVIRDTRASCPRVELAAGAFRCPRLRVEATGLPVALPPLEGSLAYDRASGTLRWSLDGATDAGRLRVEGQLGAQAWSLAVSADALTLARRDADVDDQAQWQLAGTLGLDLVAEGAAGRLSAMRLDLRGTGLSGGNAAGTRAFEGLALTGHAELQGGGELTLRGRISADAGEVYLEPVYADLSKRPIELELDGSWTGDALVLEHIDYAQQGVVSGSGSARLAATEEGWALASAQLEAPAIHLPGAYEVLFQPFLAATDLGDLATTGSLSGELVVTDGSLQAITLKLDEVFLDDRQNRLALYGLEGSLGWRPGAAGSQPPMDLAWGGGYVYGIPFGASHARMEADAGGWRLAGPVEIPILDGALEVERLELGAPAGGMTTGAIEARLRPVSMRGLARALDWPPLSGTLSGEIPSMSYRDGVLTLGGELTAGVFDGRVLVSNLRIEDPLGENARLMADIEMDGLDLERVTEAFSFGLITGRLDGYARGLQMIGWSAVAFDARLYTPEDDRSRHRISQRAVDNIASLGGSGTDPLASTFLRFFDDFSYRRMALGCRLQDGVCHMSGLEPAESGYVILAGKGLPRIEIIGHARRVSWPTLLGQLEAIIESEGPVIE